MNHKHVRLVLVPLFVLSFFLALAMGLQAGPMGAPEPLAVAAGPVCTVDPGGGGDYTTIDAALADFGCTTITIATGVYTQSLAVPRDLVMIGAGENNTVIDVGGTDRGIVLSTNITVTVSGVTVRNGGNQNHGGGVYVGDGSVFTLTDSTLSNNVANVKGGGMYMGMNATVTISGCTIVSNTATGDDGGGIYSLAPGGTLTVIGSSIARNTAGRYGGGIYQNGGATTVRSNDVVSNTATEQGGGIHAASSALVVQDSRLVGNRALGASNTGFGGGIRIAGGTLVISDSVLRGNTVSGTNIARGGAIFNDSKATLANVAIIENASAEDGGGIHNQDPMTMTNVTISGNRGMYGGGVFHTGGAPLTITHGTIVSNVLAGGGIYGGIQTYAPMYLQNTIIANNEGTNCYLGASVTSQGYNLESTDVCGLTEASDITDTNPLLVPLADNGGDTWTHALQAGSQALNAIPGGSCPVPADQRGMGRPRAVQCDIGAYEAGPLLSIDKQVDISSAGAGEVVNYTILIENSGLYSATNAVISDQLAPSLTLVGPVVLDPASAGSTGSTPNLVTGLTITPGTRITVTFPVTVHAGAPLGLIITNTASIADDAMAFSWEDSAVVSVKGFVYLPLVLRNYP